MKSYLALTVALISGMGFLVASAGIQSGAEATSAENATLDEPLLADEIAEIESGNQTVRRDPVPPLPEDWKRGPLENRTVTNEYDGVTQHAMLALFEAFNRYGTVVFDIAAQVTYSTPVDELAWLLIPLTRLQSTVAILAGPGYVMVHGWRRI